MSIYKQIYKAAQKFFSESESDVTIVLHSNAILNNDIAHLADKMKPGALVIDSRFIKLTTGEVRDMILMPDSLFRKVYNTRMTLNWLCLSLIIILIKWTMVYLGYII